MKKFPNIPKRIEEDYHSIKDDVLLVSVYTTKNVSVRGMLIPDAFLTAEIRETNDFKRYETVFIKVTVPMNQPQPVGSTQGTNRNTPRAQRSPTVFANPLETKKRKQTAGVSSSPRKTIKQKKQSTPSIPPPGNDRERDAIAEATLLSTDDESYASEFADSMLNNEGAEVDDTENIKEKETEEVGTEQNIVEKEVEDETNVEAEKTKEVVKESEVANVLGSQETRNEQMQTPIPSPIKSPRNFFVEKIQEVLQHYGKIVPELTVTKTNVMLKKEMPRLVKLAVNKDREVSPVDISGMVSKEFAAHGLKLIEELFRKHMQNTTLNLYPKTNSSTTTTSSADLQQQLYLNMMTKPQDQAANSEI
ncbi:hypothetical protein Tco_0686203 [Tanacetum coccineum]